MQRSHPCPSSPQYKKVVFPDGSVEHQYQGPHKNQSLTKNLQDQGHLRASTHTDTRTHTSHVPIGLALAGKKINLSLSEMAQFFMKMANAIKKKKLKPGGCPCFHQQSPATSPPSLPPHLRLRRECSYKSRVFADTCHPLGVGKSIPGCNSYFLCKYLKDIMLQVVACTARSSSAHQCTCTYTHVESSLGPHIEICAVHVLIHMHATLVRLARTCSARFARR